MKLKALEKLFCENFKHLRLKNQSKKDFKDSIRYGSGEEIMLIEPHMAINVIWENLPKLMAPTFNKILDALNNNDNVDRDLYVKIEQIIEQSNLSTNRLEFGDEWSCDLTGFPPNDCRY